MNVPCCIYFRHLQPFFGCNHQHTVIGVDPDTEQLNAERCPSDADVGDANKLLQHQGFRFARQRRTVAGICGDEFPWDMNITGVNEFPDMIITGVIDGPLSGGTPKAMELYVVRDIGDLSDWGLPNSNPTTTSFRFPPDSARAGDFTYVSFETANFNAFFGFDTNYTSEVLNVNGNDALLLSRLGIAVDFFGQAGQDGSGQPWAYTDSWGYRKSVVPSGSGFHVADWTFPGTNALDGETRNANATTPFPLQTFTCLPPVPTTPSTTQVPTTTSTTQVQTTTSTTQKHRLAGESCSSVRSAPDMIITGVIAGRLNKGIPTAVELLVVNDISDLSTFQLAAGCYTWCWSGDMDGWKFPSGTAAAGDFIYVSHETADFNAFFGFDPNYTSEILYHVDGMAAIWLYRGADDHVVDAFGVYDQKQFVAEFNDGWEYRNSWEYRRIYRPGPFKVNDWIHAGNDVLKGARTNADVTCQLFG